MGGHVTFMTTFSLVHPSEAIPIAFRRLVTQCDLFEDPSLSAAPYAIRSSVGLPVFKQFVAALEARSVDITRENFEGLSLLCEEFGFRAFAVKLSEFKASRAFRSVEPIDDPETGLRVAALEDHARHWDRELAGVQTELARHSHAQESTAQAIAAALARLSQFEADLAAVRQTQAGMATLAAVAELSQAIGGLDGTVGRL
jgi:hypothetical protein